MPINSKFLILVFVVNIMAREEIWIVADNDSADKMVKFHQLKNLASSDLAIAKWYLFSNFDTFTQTARDFGNAFQQLERGLLNAMKERNRPPTSIIFLLGDSFLDDSKLSLNPCNLYTVIYAMLKQLKHQVRTYTEILPNKAKPLREVKLFITNPLPKPEKFFKNRSSEFQKLAKVRHTYNDKLVSALQKLDMNFLNPGIHPSNTRAFHSIRTPGFKDKFTLTPEGLHQYWYSLSTGLEKLHAGQLRMHKPTEQNSHDNLKLV